MVTSQIVKKMDHAQKWLACLFPEARLAFPKFEKKTKGKLRIYLIFLIDKPSWPATMNGKDVSLSSQTIATASGRRHMVTQQEAARIYIRCTLAEKAKWKQDAQNSGIDLTKHIRKCLSRHGSRSRDTSGDIMRLRMLATISASLEQIARFARQYGHLGQEQIAIELHELNHNWSKTLQEMRDADQSI